MNKKYFLILLLFIFSINNIHANFYDSTFKTGGEDAKQYTVPNTSIYTNYVQAIGDYSWKAKQTVKGVGVHTLYTSQQEPYNRYTKIEKLSGSWNMTASCVINIANQNTSGSQYDTYNTTSVSNYSAIISNNYSNKYIFIGNCFDDNGTVNTLYRGTDIRGNIVYSLNNLELESEQIGLRYAPFAKTYKLDNVKSSGNGLLCYYTTNQDDSIIEDAAHSYVLNTWSNNFVHCRIECIDLHSGCATTTRSNDTLADKSNINNMKVVNSKIYSGLTKNIGHKGDVSAAVYDNAFPRNSSSITPATISGQPLNKQILVDRASPNFTKLVLDGNPLTINTNVVDFIGLVPGSHSFTFGFGDLQDGNFGVSGLKNYTLLFKRVKNHLGQIVNLVIPRGSAS